MGIYDVTTPLNNFTYPLKMHFDCIVCHCLGSWRDVLRFIKSKSINTRIHNAQQAVPYREVVYIHSGIY